MSKPILYSYFRSSSAYRVRIALNVKGVDYEYRPVHLVNDGGEQNKSDFVDLNPMKQVPFFVHENAKISQSVAIIEYIDTVWDSPRLLPRDPVGAAKVREIVEIINSGIQPLQNLSTGIELKKRFEITDDQKTAYWKHWIHKGFVALERQLKESSGTHCVGDHITTADLFLVPQVFNAERFEVDMGEFPTIKRVNEHLSKIEEFKKAHPAFQPDTPKS